jgi:hypothetical protein
MLLLVRVSRNSQNKRWIYKYTYLCIPKAKKQSLYHDYRHVIWSWIYFEIPNQFNGCCISLDRSYVSGGTRCFGISRIDKCHWDTTLWLMLSHWIRVSRVLLSSSLAYWSLLIASEIFDCSLRVSSFVSNIDYNNGSGLWMSTPTRPQVQYIVQSVARTKWLWYENR